MDYILFKRFFSKGSDDASILGVTLGSLHKQPARGRQRPTSSQNASARQAIKNFPDRRIRTDYSDNDPDWEENFYILRHSLCPAVLTENFFMDNYQDLEFLQSRAGKQAIVDTHVEGITEYLSSL